MSDTRTNPSPSRSAQRPVYGVPVGSGVRVAVRVAVGVRVRVGVAVAVNVGVGVNVRVRVAVGVRVGVAVGVTVAVGVDVRVGEGVRVAVRVGVAVAVGVDVRVGVGVRVAVCVGVDVMVGEPVGVKVGVGPRMVMEPSCTMTGVWMIAETFVITTFERCNSDVPPSIAWNVASTNAPLPRGPGGDEPSEVQMYVTPPTPTLGGKHAAPLPVMPRKGVAVGVGYGGGGCNTSRAWS